MIDHLVYPRIPSGEIHVHPTVYQMDLIFLGGPEWALDLEIVPKYQLTFQLNDLNQYT